MENKEEKEKEQEKEKETQFLNDKNITTRKLVPLSSLRGFFNKKYNNGSAIKTFSRTSSKL
jgi:hypothetical protein